jgi:putative glutathione S-transferase
VNVMGVMVEGRWVDQWYDTASTGGEFVRPDTQFRNWITPDGSAGPSGVAGFAAQRDRYHLYVSLACPWAHRTLIFRKLKQLEDLISVSVVHPHMLEQGWELRDEQGRSSDALYGSAFLHEIYRRAQPRYSGRVTVPLLWDKQRETIVSNESADIIRMFNSGFDAFTPLRQDYFPAPLRGAIDAINAKVYHYVNNGVYRCGFATTQHAYEQAFDGLFSTLDDLEQRLGQQRYLLGEEITESDWRLFTTLLRFDAVYYSHFKCNLRRIADYSNLANYVRDLYQHPGIAETVNMAHIKQHYYYSHVTINPQRIVPKGPLLDFAAAHDRRRFA